MLKLGDVVIGYVLDSNGNYDKKHRICGDIDNITNFIMTHDLNDCLITDVCDNMIMSSMTGFIDKCPDQEFLLKVVHPAILPKQYGESEVGVIRYFEHDE